MISKIHPFSFFQQTARLARIRLARNASGNAFVSRKKEADRLAEVSANKPIKYSVVGINYKNNLNVMVTVLGTLTFFRYLFFLVSLQNGTIVWKKSEKKFFF